MLLLCYLCIEKQGRNVTTTSKELKVIIATMLYIYVYIVTVAHVSIYSINKIMGFMHVFKEKNMEIMRKKQFTSSK